METLQFLFKNDAAMAVALLEALLVVGVAFGLDLDGGQVAALVALMVPVGGLITRDRVFAARTVEKEKAAAYQEGYRAAESGEV